MYRLDPPLLLCIAISIPFSGEIILHFHGIRPVADCLDVESTVQNINVRRYLIPPFYHFYSSYKFFLIHNIKCCVCVHNYMLCTQCTQCTSMFYATYLPTFSSSFGLFIYLFCIFFFFISLSFCVGWPSMFYIEFEQR